MPDNRIMYGFRWHAALDGGKSMPVPEEAHVATGAAFNVNGGPSGVALGYGDLVKRVSTGGVTMAEGNETGGGASDIAYGVIVGVGPYYDGTVMRRRNTLPSGTAYGTNLTRQTKLFVVPLTAGVWEVDCDDAVTATTLAAYQDLIGNNVDYRLTQVAADTRPTPRLDISGVNTTNTLAMRIVGISKTVHNQDFSGNFVKLLVRPNESQVPPFTILGV